jgi:hypothetical protein
MNLIEPLPFRELTLSDKGWVKKHLAESDFKACEYCFGNIFIWAGTYNYRIADYKGFLIAKAVINGSASYFFPAGVGDLTQVIRDLAKDSVLNNHKLAFGNISNDNVTVLEHFFPGAFNYTENRDASDYIYLREKLATLSGNKLHGKRNHIARFKDNADWAYEPITDKNLSECNEMSMVWCEKYIGNEEGRPSGCSGGEYNAIRQAFSNFHELELEGGLIRLNGAIGALTIGERLNSDTFVIHIEKAFRDIQGAYAIINQQFALHLPREIKYVNREDDLGNEGLRRAKMSYYPDILLTKYNAVLKDDIQCV